MERQTEEADTQTPPDTPLAEIAAHPKPAANVAGKAPVTPMPGAGDSDDSAERGLVPAWAWWAGAVAAVLILLFTVRAIYSRDRDPTPNTAADSSEVIAAVAPTITAAATWDPHMPPPEPLLGDVWQRPGDKMQMRYVPSGTFAMGSEEGDSDEQPVHDVTLDDFWIDETELTNAQYRQCVDVGECITSRYADDPKYNGQDYPVVGLSWHDADTYCRWAGGQLPSNAQWEYAARGPDANPYPWGAEKPTCELAQYRACSGDSVPVGSYPEGASWVGALDMAGNAWEWVNDWYDADYYANLVANNPEGPASGVYKVLRGAGWHDYPLYLHGSHRAYELPDSKAASFGFRCLSPGG